MSQFNLSSVFLDLPFAHRGLHGKGIAENSLESVNEAIINGYGIEVDIQALNDGSPVIFHDEYLNRLTNKRGKVSNLMPTDLATIKLLNGEKLPKLEELLDFVNGRVPILIEIKYQNGIMAMPLSKFLNKTAVSINRYRGPLAIMSFSPMVVEALQTLCPRFPRGLVTDDFFSSEWEFMEEKEKKALCELNFLEKVKLDFISHNVKKPHSSQIFIAKREKLPMLCWTVRSNLEENEARNTFHNITFEDYFPDTMVSRF